MSNIEKYICPICGQEFIKSEDVAKHSLACWREQNPNHKSKPAPRGEDKNYYEISEDAVAFFDALGERKEIEICKKSK